MAQRQAPRLLRAQSVEALNGVELMSPRSPGCPEVVRFVFNKKWYVVFFCQFISNHCVCRNPTTLQIGNTHEYTVRRQMCCFSRASGVIVVVSGPPWCQWCSDWCALGCSAAVAFGLRLFVARFWLAEVG